MKTLTFKTNINCNGCIAKVTPSLNQVKGIARWAVDTANPQRILSVDTEELSGSDIIEVDKNAGFNIEEIKQ